MDNIGKARDIKNAAASAFKNILLPTPIIKNYAQDSATTIVFAMVARVVGHWTWICFKMDMFISGFHIVSLICAHFCPSIYCSSASSLIFFSNLLRYPFRSGIVRLSTSRSIAFCSRKDSTSLKSSSRQTLLALGRFM